MGEVKTSNGTWRIHGLDFSSSDPLYYILKGAIESHNLRERHLKYVTNWKKSIIVDRPSKEIHFLNY